MHTKCEILPRCFPSSVWMSNTIPGTSLHNDVYCDQIYVSVPYHSQLHGVLQCNRKKFVLIISHRSLRRRVAVAMLFLPSLWSMPDIMRKKEVWLLLENLG